MTEYDAGRARARYELDASPFYAAIEQIKQRYAQLRQLGEQAGRQTVIPGGTAPANIPDVTPKLDRQAAAAQRAALSAAKLATEQQRTALTAQRVETEANRTAKALQDQAAAESRAAAAAAQASAAQDRAATAALRRRQAEERAANGGSFGGLFAGLRSVAGTVGIGLGVAEIGRSAIAAAQYTTSLNQTEAVLRQLSGSQERYNTLTRIAAQNQKLFGGSLAENYAPLTGVLALANQTGASLEQLNSVTQLLLAKAPTKSAGDAFFGLGELLSGKGAEAALSLADQFNLNKAALAALATEGTTAEQRLAGLTRLLAEQGVTSETLAARLTDQAQAYNRLGAAGEQAYIRLGNAANAVGVPLANFISGGLEGFTNLVDRGKELAGLSTGILDSAASYEQYAQTVAAQNEQINRTAWWQYGGAQVQQLTRAQWLYYQALVATGVAAEEARRKASGEVGPDAKSGAMAESEARQTGILVIGQMAESADQTVAQLADRLLTLAAAGGESEQSALSLARLWGAGNISLEALVGQVGRAEQALQLQRQASEGAAEGTKAVAAALDFSKIAADAQKSALEKAAQAAFEVANAGGDVDAQARAAGDALLAAGRAGQLAAGQLAGSTSDIDKATFAYYRLAAAQQAARDRGRDGGLLGGPNERPGLTPAQQARLDAEAQAKFEAQLQDDITRATGSTADRLALVNEELAKAKPLSDERRQLLVEQAQLEQQLAEEQQRAAESAAREREQAGKKAASEAKQAADRERQEAEARLREQEQTQRQIERRTEDHYRRLRQMAEDNALDASRKEEDFQEERQRLLAEGQIKEAQLLAAKYAKEQRRANEDAARARQRQNEDFANDVARTQQDNARDTARLDRRYGPAAVPTVPATAVAAAAEQAQAAGQAQAILAATAAQRPTTTQLRLQVQIAPTSVQIGPEQIVMATWPLLEQLVDVELADAIATTTVVAPPAGGQQGGVGGPRP